MNNFNPYKVELTHLFTGEKRIINLGKTKLEAQSALKEATRRFSFLWRKSQIHC